MLRKQEVRGLGRLALVGAWPHLPRAIGLRQALPVSTDPETRPRPALGPRVWGLEEEE